MGLSVVAQPVRKSRVAMKLKNNFMGNLLIRIFIVANFREKVAWMECNDIRGF